MSSNLTRRFLGLTALAALAGCGFTPAFGSDGTAQKLRDAVQVTTPDTVLGFAMRSRVNDRLGAAASPLYALTMDLNQTEQAAAITSDGDTTRFQIGGVTRWSLTDIASGAVLASGQSETFASYAATGSTVATQAAAADAGNRLAIALADQVVSDMTLAAGAFP